MFLWICWMKYLGGHLCCTIISTFCRKREKKIRGPKEETTHVQTTKWKCMEWNTIIFVFRESKAELLHITDWQMKRRWPLAAIRHARTRQNYSLSIKLDHLWYVASISHCALCPSRFLLIFHLVTQLMLLSKKSTTLISFLFFPTREVIFEIDHGKNQLCTITLIGYNLNSLCITGVR